MKRLPLPTVACVAFGALVGQTVQAGILVTAEAPGVQATQVSGATTMDFNSPTLAVGKYLSLTTPIGVYSAPNPGLAVVPADLYGGASKSGVPDREQTQYMAIGAQSGQVDARLDLAEPHSYFGLYWPAGDESNVLEFHRGGALVASYHVGDVIAAIDGNRAYLGNPNIGGNLVEPYVYLNFFGTGGTTFDQVVFHNLVNFRGFESDNHSVRVAPVADPPGNVIGELPEVPEPASSALAVVGLVFLGIVSIARTTTTSFERR